MVSTMRCAFCVCGLVMLVATAAVDVAAQNAASTERSWSLDRKSTRLNSSHALISYAVFCLKKKKKKKNRPDYTNKYTHQHCRIIHK